MGQLYTSFMAIIGIEFQDKNYEEQIGWIEMSAAAGVTIGPAVGSLLYGIGGFSLIFYAQAALFSIFIFLPKIVLSKDCDRKTEKEEDKKDKENEETDEEVVKRITYKNIAWNFRVILAVMTCTFVWMNITFVEPIWAIRAQDFGYDQSQAGYFFSFLTVPYIFGCPTV